jgi:hypothetical protein
LAGQRGSEVAVGKAKPMSYIKVEAMIEDGRMNTSYLLEVFDSRNINKQIESIEQMYSKLESKEYLLI